RQAQRWRPRREVSGTSRKIAAPGRRCRRHGLTLAVAIRAELRVARPRREFTSAVGGSPDVSRARGPIAPTRLTLAVRKLWKRSSARNKRIAVTALTNLSCVGGLPFAP